MDTREWGPSGWPLFHSIAYYYDNYEDREDKVKIIKRFFKSIQHVLPCIYCKRSYKQYIKEIPIFNRDKDIFRWSYKIHNKVNDKLRKQGYNEEPNPSYDAVLKKYKKYFDKNRNCTEMGWKFLYSIIFNYDEGISYTRKKGYITFFYLLGYVLPNENSRIKYLKYISKNPIEKEMCSKGDIKKWMYRLEKTFKSKCCSYKSRCKSIEKYKVNKCSGNTCRI